MTVESVDVIGILPFLYYDGPQIAVIETRDRRLFFMAWLGLYSGVFWCKQLVALPPGLRLIKGRPSSGHTRDLRDFDWSQTGLTDEELNLIRDDPFPGADFMASQETGFLACGWRIFKRFQMYSLSHAEWLEVVGGFLKLEAEDKLSGKDEIEFWDKHLSDYQFCNEIPEPNKPLELATELGTLRYSRYLPVDYWDGLELAYVEGEQGCYLAYRVTNVVDGNDPEVFYVVEVTESLDDTKNRWNLDFDFDFPGEPGSEFPEEFRAEAIRRIVESPGRLHRLQGDRTFRPPIVPGN